MIALLYAMLSTGCVFAPPDCADNFERIKNGKCQAIDGSDTASNGIEIDGTYTGSITIDVEADLSGSSLADVCDGDVGFEVSEDALSGAVYCNFSGPFNDVLQDQTFEGTIDGEVNAEGTVQGDVELDLDAFGLLQSGWTGTFAGEQIDGTFEGTMQVPFGALEIPVYYSGRFQASP